MNVDQTTPVGSALAETVATAGHLPEPAGASLAGDGAFVTRVLPVIEESLQIAKRLVDKGGYRISKRVTPEDVTVDELLERHDVTVERRPIGTTLAHGELPQPRQEGDTWIVPVIKEVVVTEKRLVLVEEVRITRSSSNYREPQRVTLRKEEISVERIGPDPASVSGLL